MTLFDILISQRTLGYLTYYHNEILIAIKAFPNESFPLGSHLDSNK